MPFFLGDTNMPENNEQRVHEQTQDEDSITQQFPPEKDSNVIPVFFYYRPFTCFFIRNWFIGNLHVEGKKTSGTFTTKGKITKELLILNILSFRTISN